MHTHEYSLLSQSKGLLANHDPILIDLAPVKANRFEGIIEGPAERARDSFTIEPTLIQRLLDDYSEGSAPLPLLSLALCELVADYANDRQITLDEYDGSSCRIDRLLQREIDATIDADASQRGTELKALKDAFIPWLVGLNDNDRPVGITARWTDLPSTRNRS